MGFRELACGSDAGRNRKQVDSKYFPPEILERMVAPLSGMGKLSWEKDLLASLSFCFVGGRNPGNGVRIWTMTVDSANGVLDREVTGLAYGCDVEEKVEGDEDLRTASRVCLDM